MGKKKNKDKWVRKFKIEALPKLITEFDPEQILFFGSRIKGSPRKNSDLDIIIISESFKNIPFVNRMGLILKKIKFPKHVDYLCYTIKEFEKIKNESSLIIDALEYAELINI